MTDSTATASRTRKRKSVASASRGLVIESTGSRAQAAESQPASDNTPLTPAPAKETQFSINAELARKVAFVASSDGRRKLFDQFFSALEEGAPDVDEVEIRRRISDRFSQLPADADSHVKKVADRSSKVSEFYEDLLTRSRAHKAKVLRSAEFKSVAQASRILAVSEDLLRRRIRLKTQFALTNDEGGVFRIPVWTLDKSLEAGVMRRLLACADSSGMNPWALELFMKSPNGELDGFCPLDVLTLRTNRKDVAKLDSEKLVKDLSTSPRRAALERVCAAVVREMQLYQHSGFS